MKTKIIDGKKQAIYTLTDLATAMGVNTCTVWNWVYRSPELPEPDIAFGQRKYWSAALFASIVHDWKTSVQ